MGTINMDRQGATYLLILVMIAQIFTPMPRMIAERVGTSAWLVTLIAGMAALGGYLLLYLLLCRFPGRSLAQITQEVFGKWLGGILGMAYVAYLVLVGGLILREFVASYRIAVIPRTPPSVLTLLFLFVVLYAAYRGMETLGRMAAYLFPILMALLLLTLTGTARIVHLPQIFPLFGNGAALTLVNGLQGVSIYSDLLVLGAMAPLLRRQELNRVGLVGLAVAVVIVTVMMLILGSIFPYPALSRLVFPVLDLTRMVEISDFITRIEAIFVFLWFFTAGFKVSLVLLSAALYFRDLAQLEDQRPLLWALSLIAYTISFLPPDEVTAAIWDTEIVQFGAWPVTFGLPILTLLASLLLGKRGATPDATQPLSG